MFQRALTAVLISIFLFSSFSDASQADKAYQSAKQSYSKLKKSKKLRQSGSSWMKVIENFRTFAEKHPGDKRADGIMLTIGELYEGLYDVSERDEDIDSAIEAYQTLEKKFPKSRLADDAVFRIGELYLNDRDVESAYLEFKKVVQKYPKGDMASKASARMKELAAEIESEAAGKSKPDINKKIYVSDIKYWSNPDYTRVVIYADGKVSFKETFLNKKDGDKPPRLFLDISGSKLSGDLRQPININDGLLKMARAGQFDLNTVRVVLDIESMDSYKIFALEDPYRIVIDVSGEKRNAGPADHIAQIITKTDDKPDSPSNAAVPLPAKKGEDSPSMPSLAQQFGLGIKKIVVDPGHGGHDAGAIGYRGIKEKDVVLDVGKKLRKILTEELGVEVVMTRDTDIFIPLEERTAIANTAGADLFISLHCNASRNRKAGGIETYFLNLATDEDSMRIAARENATSAKNISDLQAILNDLMLNSKVNESSKLARMVQGSLLDILSDKGDRPVDRGVKQAPFYVLIGAQMPSILVEMSFITNREEARRLTKDKFQKTVAASIAEGVKKYSEVIKLASY